MKDQWILNTAKFSSIVQVFVGVLGIQGIWTPVPEKHQILIDILTLETVVQFIELAYYAWLIYCFKQLTYDITFTRYFDWLLSTPIMLVSTLLFMEYNTKLDQSDSTKTEILQMSDIFGNNAGVIGLIVVANFLMLLFGFLGERQLISRFAGFVFGTVAFCYSFYLLHERFVGLNLVNQYLFWFMFVVWSLYGVAYLFSYHTKNIAYNFLDIFSKNFYGLFLCWQIMQLSTATV